MIQGTAIVIGKVWSFKEMKAQRDRRIWSVFLYNAPHREQDFSFEDVVRALLMSLPRTLLPLLHKSACEVVYNVSISTLITKRIVASDPLTCPLTTRVSHHAPLCPFLPLSPIPPFSAFLYFPHARLRICYHPVLLAPDRTF